MKFLLAFAVIVTVVSCSKNDEPAVIATAETRLNVAYGNQPLQNMDIYLPPGRNIASTPSIILIHGGGWATGDKSASTRFVDSIKRRMPHYAVFNINYRLAVNGVNLFPTQENDVRSAIEYIYNNRNAYLISGRFVLIGESAGGHLSMLQAYKNNASVKAAAVVSFFGPSDLTDMYNNPVNGNPLIPDALIDVTGTTPSQNPAIYFNSSPANFITTQSGVPTILFHGGMDALVAPAHSALVYDRLTNAGIAAQYHLYPDKNHGYDWDDATFYDAFNKMQVFLETYVP